MKRQLLSLGVAGLLAASAWSGMGPVLAGPAAAPLADSRFFPQTGQTVSGLFLDYWNSHGALPQQGFPISNEFTEVNDLNHLPYTVQYFERAVFEKHPENAPPFDVLLSQLGKFQYDKKYPTGAPGQHVSTVNPRFFNETGHTLGGIFRTYWENHGGLAQQGYPLSDEFTEVSDLNGLPYMVQYFERAVFEYHPENAGTPFEVLLSQLGTFQYNCKYKGGPCFGSHPATATPGAPPPAATATATAPPAATATATPVAPPPITAAMYVGTWYNDDLSTGGAVRYEITAVGNILTVHWFGACSPNPCDNGSKSAPYTGEPFVILFNPPGFPTHQFTMSIMDAGATRLKAIDVGSASGTHTYTFHRATAAMYAGTWFNDDPNTGGVVRFEISHTGSILNVHWFGACSPNPCDNGTKSLAYTGEPFVILFNPPGFPTHQFTMRLFGAAGSKLQVVDVGSASGTHTYTFHR